MQKIYTPTTVSALIDAIIEKTENKADILQTSEGVLGMGDWIIQSNDENFYSYVIKEIYLNSQSSGQTIRKYRKLPKKYAKLIENNI